ncbi:hypothetical protein FS749_013958 [Ceratobasidium sp. UAMH 11750]|nr:hypothetical protein FS749_013958 [Ceratobasidium sp. UAMH 11750]
MIQESVKLNKQKVDVFRRTFSQPSAEVHFLGAWDTVSSIGIRRRTLLPLTDSYQHIRHFRHALALDERRVKFLPEHVEYPTDGSVDDNHVKEVWFAGTHSDIGGGNTRNIQLNRGTESLVWMMNEAEDVGLKLDPKNLGDGVKRTHVIPSLSGGWWILEVLPLTRLAYGTQGQHTVNRPHLGKGRRILGSHKIHYSVLANSLQIEKEYQPHATYREPGPSGLKVEWERIFSEAETAPETGTCGLRWEGDRRIIDALRIIQEAESKSNASPWGDERAEAWLVAVEQLVSDDALAKMIWEYGSLQFLLKIAQFKNSRLVREIVRAVLGMGNKQYLGTV